MPRPVSFAIRPMEMADLEEVLSIERASFPVPWTEKGFHEELARPFSHLYVAKTQQDEPVSVLGYICFWILEYELHLLDLAVHPDYRRRGIGESLIEFALSMGMASEIEIAVLEVRPSNTAAIRLYGKAGFIDVGRRPGYYSDSNEDAIIMELTL